jgi:hypothetical protein
MGTRFSPPPRKDAKRFSLYTLLSIAKNNRHIKICFGDVPVIFLGANLRDFMTAEAKQQRKLTQCYARDILKNTPEFCFPVFFRNYPEFRYCKANLAVIRHQALQRKQEELIMPPAARKTL